MLFELVAVVIETIPDSFKPVGAIGIYVDEDGAGRDVPFTIAISMDLVGLAHPEEHG